MVMMQAHASTDALYRKIALRIVPFLFICYVVNFIDRVNIGFAKLQFLDDLGLDDGVFGVAAGMFFIGYVIFEIPSNLMLGRIGARKTLMRIMVLWGGFTVLLAFVQTATWLYVLRFLLGAAEAGFFPGIVLYLTYWFPSRRRGRVMSLFIMAVPIAGIIGGPVSGAIMSHFQHVAGLRGWQWLFVAEGVPAIALGLLALVCLKDAPHLAAWLNADERARLAADLQADHALNSASKIKHLGDLLRSPRLYLMAAIYFTIFAFLNAIGFWIPTVLKSVGAHSVAQIGWLAGAIATAAAIGVLVVGYHSDRTMERRWHVAGCGFASAVAFLLLPLAAHDVGFSAALLGVASIGIYSVLSIFWTIPTAYLQGDAAAGGIAFITAVGAIGGAMSPSIVGLLKTHTGSLYMGLSAIAVLLVVGMLALLWFVPANRETRAGKP
jgi:sugar phosphate permease